MPVGAAIDGAEILRYFIVELPQTLADFTEIVPLEKFWNMTFTESFVAGLEMIVAPFGIPQI